MSSIDNIINNRLHIRMHSSKNAKCKVGPFFWPNIGHINEKLLRKIWSPKVDCSYSLAQRKLQLAFGPSLGGVGAGGPGGTVLAAKGPGAAGNAGGVDVLLKPPPKPRAVWHFDWVQAALVHDGHLFT